MGCNTPPIKFDPETSLRMKKIRRSKTRPEIELRNALWAGGYRGYRVDKPVLGARGPSWILPTFGRRLALFVDGCFWHRCPTPRTDPKTNASWWQKKLRANEERDDRVTGTLVSNGWNVLRVWEHTDPEQVLYFLNRFDEDQTNTFTDSDLRYRAALSAIRT